MKEKNKKAKWEWIKKLQMGRTSIKYINSINHEVLFVPSQLFLPPLLPSVKDQTDCYRDIKRDDSVRWS